MTPTTCGKIVKRRLRGWPPRLEPFGTLTTLTTGHSDWATVQNFFPTIHALYGMMTIHVLLFLCANMFCMRTPSCNVRNIPRPVENCTVHPLIKSFVRLQHRIFSYICVFEKKSPKNVQAYGQSKLKDWRIGMHPTVPYRRVWCRWSILHHVATKFFSRFSAGPIFLLLKKFRCRFFAPSPSRQPSISFLLKNPCLFAKINNLLIE